MAPAALLAAPASARSAILPPFHRAMCPSSTSPLTLPQPIPFPTHCAQGVNLQRFITAYIELQVAVNCLFDSSQNKDASKSMPAGIKQRLEKKEGLFRKHMMVRPRPFPPPALLFSLSLPCPAPLVPPPRPALPRLILGPLLWREEDGRASASTLLRAL